MLYSSKFNPYIFLYNATQVTLDMFLKEMYFQEKIVKRSIILQFHPLGIMKPFAVSGPALHWVKRLRWPTSALPFPCNLGYVT